MSAHSFYELAIMKNIEVISNSKIIIDNKLHEVPLIKNSNSRILVIILSWILAEKKHVQKFCKIYLAKNFDVLTVSITVTQLLWPTTGSQVVAQNLLDFLNENDGYKFIVHGFSVGGYLWGELLVKVSQDLDKYQPLIKRFLGQIWDSTPDVTEIHKGLPQAVFPTSPVLRNICEIIIGFHLSAFRDSTTRHYKESSHFFHYTPIRVPSLVFVAENDTIASLKSILKAKNVWDSLGMTTYIKSWKNSKHVSHFHLHREEYLESLEDFLSTLNISKAGEPLDKIQAKL